MKECLDIGTIQAFLDGETVPAMSINVSNHIAACDDCALLLADAEEQSSTVFSILDREMNSMVPTHRLWTRINETIETEKARTPFWKRAFGAISFYLATPSMATASGLLVVVGFLAVVWMGTDGTTNDLAVKSQNGQRPAAVSETGLGLSPTAETVGTFQSPDAAPTEPNRISSQNDAPRVVKAAHRVSNESRDGRRNNTEDAHEETLMYLPGEESYIKTIAELRASVDDQKDMVLSPSSRVDFERDLAVVDDAISRMRGVVAKDPNNQAARQVLYAAYQDKIDILSSVGQREELIASLK